MVHTRGFFIFIVLFVIGSFWITSTSSAIVAVDLGTEWYKVLLMQGKNFDIVLNDQSGRKTYSLVGFTPEGERVFGSRATPLLTKNRDRVFSSVHLLLGKNFSNPVIEQSKHHYSYPLVEEDGAYGIYLDEENTFSPEEIVAMIFNEAQKIVASTKTGFVKDLALIVPPFATQHERKAWINAAQIAGMNTLALVNEGMAAAVNYAFTRAQGNDVNMYLIIYDMGAGCTSATLVNITSDFDKKNNSVLNVKTTATAWDQNLGGRDFDYRLALRLLEEVETKYKVNLRDNKRVLPRLIKEAQKTKEILSANKEARVYVESLTPEIDFTTLITREDFEEICSDLFARVVDPVRRVLDIGGIQVDQVTQMEVVGGGVRLARVHELLSEFLGSPVGRHLNGDEAAINGAALFGATQSSTLKVKNPIIIKDTLPFPIGVDFELGSEIEGEDSLQLFPVGREFGAKKVLTLFSNQPFFLNVVYEDYEYLPPGTDKLIARYQISDIPSNTTHGNFITDPEIQLKFTIKPSTGLVELVRARAKVRALIPQKKQLDPSEYVADEVESIDDQPPVVAENETTEEPIVTESQNNNSSEQSDGIDGEPDVEQEVELDVEQDINSDTASNNEPDAEADINQESNVEMELVEKVEYYELKITEITLGVDMDKSDIVSGKSRLRSLDRKDEERLEKDKSKNELEAFVYATRERMYDDQIKEISTETERDELSSALMDIGDWLYDEGFDTTASIYRQKLSYLQQLSEKIFLRQSEISIRPQAVKLWNQWKEQTFSALENITNERNVDEEERQALLDSINEAEVWLNAKQEEQLTKQLFEDPAWTTFELYSKQTTLDSELKRLLRRSKRRPSPSPTPTPIPTIEQSEENEQDFINFDNIIFGDDIVIDDIVADDNVIDDSQQKNKDEL